MLDTYSIIRGCIQIEKYKTSAIVPLDSYILKGSAWLLLKFRCVYCTVECRRAFYIERAGFFRQRACALEQSGCSFRRADFREIMQLRDTLTTCGRQHTYKHTPIQHSTRMISTLYTTPANTAIRFTWHLSWYFIYTGALYNKYDPMLILHVQ